MTIAHTGNAVELLPSASTEVDAPPASTTAEPSTPSTQAGTPAAATSETQAEQAPVESRKNREWFARYKADADGEFSGMFYEYLHALYGAVEDQLDGLFITVSAKAPDEDARYLSLHRPYTEDGRGDLWAFAHSQSLMGSTVYISLAPRTSALRSHQRGTAEDCAGLPAWIIDVDLRGGQHKANAERLPTAGQADAVMARLAEKGLVPSFSCDTGGGMHHYLVAERLIESRTSAEAMRRRRAGDPELWEYENQGRETLVGFDWLAKAEFSKDGFGLDTLAKNGALCLRPAGALSKYGTLVRFIAGSGAVYQPSQIAAVAPLPTREIRPEPERAEPGTSRPGDWLSVQVNPVDLIAALWPGFRKNGRTGVLHYVLGDSNPRQKAVGWYDTRMDGAITATVYSANAQAALGLSGHNHALTSWGVLGLKTAQVAAPDEAWRLAGKVIGHFSQGKTAENVDWAPMIAFLREHGADDRAAFSHALIRLGCI